MTTATFTSIASAGAQPRQFLEYLYHAAVTRALPLHNTAAYLPGPPRGRTLVLGAGKAGGSMAQAVYLQAVVTRVMSMNNASGIIEAERQLHGQWFESGAKID